MSNGYFGILVVRCVALSMVVLGVALTAAFVPAVAQNFGPLDGTWEGELTDIDARHPERDTKSWSRIVIQDYRAHVFYRRKDGQIVEVKPGKFQVQKLLTNAIIAAIDMGNDNEGRWVETWVFTVTQKDSKTLMAQFNRMVNNNNLPLTVGHSKFASYAEGELLRK